MSDPLGHPIIPFVEELLTEAEGPEPFVIDDVGRRSLEAELKKYAGTDGYGTMAEALLMFGASLEVEAGCPDLAAWIMDVAQAAFDLSVSLDPESRVEHGVAAGKSAKKLGIEKPRVTPAGLESPTAAGAGLRPSGGRPAGPKTKK